MRAVPRILGGEGFIPKNHREIGLSFQGFGKSPGTAAFEGWMAIIIKRLPDHDETSAIRSCKFRHGRGVLQAGNVVEHRQRVGNGAGWIADGETDAF